MAAGNSFLLEACIARAQDLRWAICVPHHTARFTGGEGPMFIDCSAHDNVVGMRVDGDMEVNIDGFTFTKSPTAIELLNGGRINGRNITHRVD